MKRFLIGLVVCFLLPMGFGCGGSTTAQPRKEQLSLEETYRTFHKGMSSDKKEDRVAALDAILPTKDDIEYLFPKDGGKLWKVVEPQRKESLEHVDELAREITRHGAIKEVKAEDLRKGDDISASYRRLFEKIPKDVPVFEVYCKGEDGGAASEAYVFLNNRWVFIRDLNHLPDALEKDK